MSGTMEVGGFADLAAKVAGLAWRLDGDEGGLLLLADDVRAAEAQIEADGDGARISLRAGGVSCEAELSPRPGMVSLQAQGSEPMGGPIESGRCAAIVKTEGAGAGRSLDCDGHLSRLPAGGAEGVELIRHLTIPAADGGLLILTAARPAGARAHGEEDVSAWLIDVEGGITGFAESLLSSQYDAEGRPTRVGLELWPGGEEAPPLRGAGSRLGGTDDGGGGVSAALLSTSVEGAEGIGSYLIWRP